MLRTMDARSIAVEFRQFMSKRSWLTFDLSFKVAIIGFQTLFFSRNQRASCNRISYGAYFVLDNRNVTVLSMSRDQMKEGRIHHCIKGL